MHRRFVYTTDSFLRLLRYTGASDSKRERERERGRERKRERESARLLLLYIIYRRRERDTSERLSVIHYIAIYIFEAESSEEKARPAISSTEQRVHLVFFYKRLQIFHERQPAKMVEKILEEREDERSQETARGEPYCFVSRVTFLIPNET